MQVTNVDIGGVVFADGEFMDGLLTFEGAGTVKAGTILARDTATLKFVVFEKGGTTNGNGVPSVVLVDDVVATGAGDVYCRPLMAGKVVQSKLVIDADGDGSNVDAAVLDGLRSFSVVPVKQKELGMLDNQ